MDLFAVIPVIYFGLVILVVLYLLSVAGRVTKEDMAAAQKALSNHFAPHAQPDSAAPRKVASPPEKPKL